MEIIYASRWYRGPHELTFEAVVKDYSKFPEPSDCKLLEALCPNDQETMAVLGFCRQLHAGDELFSKAATTYMEHCGDVRKRDWVADRKVVFSHLVDSSPQPFGIRYTRREICRLFMYGAGMLHAESNDGSDEKLKALVKERGQENVVNIFNHCLLDFVSVAFELYHVLRPDFEHWIKDHGLAGPDRPRIGALFASLRKR
jgi:hypothetical protein